MIVTALVGKLRFMDSMEQSASFRSVPIRDQVPELM